MHEHRAVFFCDEAGLPRVLQISIGQYEHILELSIEMEINSAIQQDDAAAS